jgi:hypothetical protein
MPISPNIAANEVIPSTAVSAEEWQEFRNVCSRLMADGQVAGEFAAEMLRISDRLMAMREEVQRFLAK